MKPVQFGSKIDALFISVIRLEYPPPDKPRRPVVDGGIPKREQSY
jgi:hypothetical protein